MAEDMQRIIEISDPDECICDVADFDLRHRTMVIEINRRSYDSGERFFLHFPGVIYFSGPTGWRGARFEAGTEEEHLAILNCLDVINKGSRNPYLYKVNSPSGNVQFLALAMGMSEEFSK